MLSRLFALTLCILLSACALPGGQADPSVRAWFDMPVPNTVLHLQDPCQVIAHGASSAGIAAFELSVNGSVAANVPVSGSKSTLATLNRECGPLQSGKNLLEVRAQAAGGAWSGRTQTFVFLEDAPVREVPSPGFTETRPPVPSQISTRPPTQIPTPLPTQTPTLVPTLIPTETPAPGPVGEVTIESISTDLVYIGGSSCGTTEVTIVARATAPNGIRVVVLFYRFETGDSSGGFESLGMTPIGGDRYQAVLNPTSLLGRSVPFDEAVLQYQIVIQQNDGDTSIRTRVRADIAVKACGGRTLSCSAYTDERTCVANRCSWVNIPGTVPIYECRNP